MLLLRELSKGQALHSLCVASPSGWALALFQKTLRSEMLSCSKAHSQEVAERDSNQYPSHLIQRHTCPSATPKRALLCPGPGEGKAGCTAGPAGREPRLPPATTELATKPSFPGDSKEKSQE